MGNPKGAHKGPVTQRDIAEQAGVTQMTVSLALRGSASVSKATVKRIRELAEEMGYAPNPLVSSLMRTRRSRGQAEAGLAIAWHGVFSALRRRDRGRPDLCDTYAEMLAGATEACRRNGFLLEKFPLNRLETQLPRILHSRGIRGMILGPTGPKVERKLKTDELRGVHLVRIERDFRESQYDRVVNNAFEEMRTCVRALVRAGCRRIGYIDNIGHQESSEDRWKGGFLSVEDPETSICPAGLSNSNRLGAGAVLGSYLREHKPEGLVIGSRMFIQAMIDREPRDRIPFACLERNNWPDWVSGVETNFRAIGAEAARLLIDRILSPHASDPVHRTIAIHSFWREGSSHRLAEGQAKHGF
jgi:LacI family transcriptional regulator